MSAGFDREALATLRAILRAGVMSVTSGVHHLPPEIVKTKAAGDALAALRAAFEALHPVNEDHPSQQFEDALADLLDRSCDLRDGLAPLQAESFDVQRLYCLATVARAASLQRRGAPIAGADNLVRLPVNAGHAMLCDGVDWEAAAVLRAMARFILGEMHCGLKAPPPAGRRSQGRIAASEACHAAIVRLRCFDDRPADVFALLLACAKAIAPLGRGGFRKGFIVAELYARAVLARAKLELKPSSPSRGGRPRPKAAARKRS